MHQIEAHEILLSDKPGFSWRRLARALFEERTCTLEAILGLVFILIRGVALIGYSYYTPGIESYLKLVGLSESRLGWLCIIIGLLHPYGAGTLRFRFRAWISAFVILLSIAVIMAVMQGGPAITRPIAVVWMSILICEVFLAFRNWLARDAAKVVLKNNGL